MAARVAAGVLIAATAVIAGLSIAGPEPDPWQPRFHAFHYNDEIVEGGFKEIFIIHDVDSAFRVVTQDVALRLDGAPHEVTWNDTDGILSEGDRFWFIQEAFDPQQTLTGWHDGDKVMECRFGGGAALGRTPDEWRADGQPEMVRCLDPVPDG